MSLVCGRLLFGFVKLVNVDRQRLGLKKLTSVTFLRSSSPWAKWQASPIEQSLERKFLQMEVLNFYILVIVELFGIG